MSINIQREENGFKQYQEVIEANTQKAVNRIRQYSGQELKGKELCQQLSIRHLGV